MVGKGLTPGTLLMLRLSVMYRRPLHEVRGWPASDIRLLSKYLGKAPAHEDRTETLLAQLLATYINAHQRAGDRPKAPADFMPWRDAWKPADAGGDGRYSDVDKSFMRALIGSK